MKKSDYSSFRTLNPVDYAEQIFLPPGEYANIISEFNTNMSEEDRRHRIVTKPIGDYWYTVINMGFNDYIVIRKTPITQDSYYDKDWEDIQYL